MSQKQGIKETKEAMIGVLVLATLLSKHLKDGFQLGKDATAIWLEIQSNDELKNQFVAAYEGYNMIDDELKDIDLKESFELVAAAGPEIQKLIEQLRS